tara:strand:+ start:126 stop:278 length:153 start_codon:yes stop_codon:yes gene_type:complete
MTGGSYLLLFVGVYTVVMFFGASYPHYKKEGRWPWQSPKKDGVNSGAKFG